MVRKLFMFVVLVFGCASGFAAPIAHVDRTQINEGETFRLTLEVQEGEPDLSPLHALFDVLGTSKNSQMSFVNGRLESKSEWVITLSPKQVGNLTIPSLRVGKTRSDPILVSVTKAGSQSGAGAERDIYIEVEATPKNAYVQSQIIYTMKLFHAVNIRDGGISEPKIDNAVIERFGNDINYQTVINGRRYQVTERRFAIFPQQSGKITIPPTVFGGQIVSAMGGGFGMDPFNRFFSQPTSKPVRLRSETIELDIKPRPASVSGTTWLPAESLTLSAMWSTQPDNLRVGEPVTLTLRIEAEGLTGAQLPEVQVPIGKEFKTYPDQPIVETINNGRSLVGIREQKIAVVPNSAGIFEIPSVRLPWWNTRTDNASVATTPKATLNVSPSVQENPAASSPVSDTKTGTTAADEIAATIPGPEASAPLYLGWSSREWAWATFFAVGVWLLTILFWAYRSRRPDGKARANMERNSDSRATFGNALTRIKHASLTNDPREVRRALLDWGQARWPEEQRPLSLAEIGQRLDDASVGDKFAELNSILYAKQPQSWDGQAFWETVAPLLKSKPDKGRADLLLPALYQ